MAARRDFIGGAGRELLKQFDRSISYSGVCRSQQVIFIGIYF